MALYAFNGTWNEEEDAPEENTNVVKFRDIYEGPVEYRDGVGTRFGPLGRFLGGVFGAGGRSRVEEMYDAARANWKRGDHVVDIVGFSRGAALAVHFANVLGRQGLRLDGDRTEFPEIRFLGLWDIVGSFGIPKDLIVNFQHINLGWTIDSIPANVQRCVHAMALDERRETFHVTRLAAGEAKRGVDELWFRGVHSDVGGGNRNVLRNNIALQWMLEEAAKAGLPVPAARINLVAAETDRLAPISTNFDIQRDPRRITNASDRYHPTAVATVLQPGESASFRVRAADRYNWSGVRLQANGAYEFALPDGQKWQDSSIVCGADGWTTEALAAELPWYKEGIIRRFESQRRLPAAAWFELVGALDDEDKDLFRIGLGCRHVPRRDADLYAFANDLMSKYGNNSGELRVNVTRVS